MKRSFGHADAGRATPESLDTIIENNPIRDFLNTNDKRYIVAPKGCGKTLLLLRKAIDQRADDDGICIPSDSGNPVDRLTASQHVGLEFNRYISNTPDEHLGWASVWKHSIYRSVLHHVRETILDDLKTGRADTDQDVWNQEVEAARFRASRKVIDKYINDLVPMPRGPYFYYTEIGAILDSNRDHGLRRVREDNQELESLLQIINRPVYIFLDNLDDYYESEPDLWVSSMYGQFRAVREISLTQRHIHIFTSIRRDVFTQFKSEMGMQYHDYIAHLSYSKDELRRIFEAHIKELDDDLLMQPAARDSDPWQAFFGLAITITNGIVGTEEHVWDYIHRHTLGRPRDLIHMGFELLRNRSDEGFTTDDVRDAVSEAEAHIARQYVAEVSPMLTLKFDIKEFVRSFVTSNVLNREQLDDVRDNFMESRVDDIDFDTPSDLTRPFETLYALGLLGIAKARPNTLEMRQTFCKPGSGLQDAVNRDLADSEAYFLHPILTRWITQANCNKDIVVGDQLPYVPEKEAAA